MSPTNSEELATPPFDRLPAELTIEILSRLPVKDIIRSSTVHKSWYSLIYKPAFISSQIHKAISCKDNHMLICPHYTCHPYTLARNYCYLISADANSAVIETYEIPFDTPTRGLKLVGQIHGMVLFTDTHRDYCSKELYLWNPCVRSHRLLPSTCYREHLDNRNHYLVGLGFDELHEDYKLVRVIYARDDKGMLLGGIEPFVEIFSVKLNVWRQIRNSRVSRLVDSTGVYAKGLYYWVEMAPEMPTRNGVIMFFDFQTEMFGEFEIPVPHVPGSPFTLLRFQDSLVVAAVDAAVTGFNLSVRYLLWLITHDNGVVTVTDHFATELTDFGIPLGITDNGTLIIEAFRLTHGGMTSIVSFHLQSLVYKDHGYGQPRSLDLSQSFVSTGVHTPFPHSLIMLPAPTLPLDVIF